MTYSENLAGMLRLTEMQVCTRNGYMPTDTEVHINIRTRK